MVGMLQPEAEMALRCPMAVCQLVLEPGLPGGARLLCLATERAVCMQGAPATRRVLVELLRVNVDAVQIVFTRKERCT